MELGGRRLRAYVAADMKLAWNTTKIVKGFRKLTTSMADYPIGFIQSEPIEFDNSHTLARSLQQLTVHCLGHFKYPEPTHIDRLEDIAEEYAQVLVDRLIARTTYGDEGEFFHPYITAVDVSQDEDSASQWVQCLVTFTCGYEPVYTRLPGPPEL